MTPPEQAIRRAQETIRVLHDELEQTNREVMALTLELEQRVDALRLEVAERKKAESERQAQVDRLSLLHQITRAIGERQDLPSVFQVAVRSLEESLPVAFASVCLYEPTGQTLTVASIGARSGDLAPELAVNPRVSIRIDEPTLSRCIQGELAYEPDASSVPYPFAQRLASAGLQALVLAPLRAEGALLGVLVAARCEPDGFSSGDREFLRQLSEHVALAAHQAQLYGALEQSYEDLRHTQQTVMQHERLRVLGQMASGIAHDINNAISPIALYTEALLEREPTLSARGRNYLAVINRAIEDIAATVSRLREFYRPREEQMLLARVNINSLIEQAVSLTQARWRDVAQEHGVVIDLRTELAAELPELMGAEGEIRDALTNLIFNAVDAMPKGGQLTLRTRLIAGDHTATSVNAADRILLEVADTGIGMDEETRRRCLEPFYTTKGERGTGLGLAMVYGMVRRHSAEIEIESLVGRGTTVRLVFLPVQLLSNALVPSTSPTPLRELRILLVDDDPNLSHSLRDVLQADGHSVTTADGGQHGIDAFAAAHGSGNAYDIVITDLGMPQVGGREVAAAVKALSPTTPVILLTGWGRGLVADNAIPPHVDVVLSKPPRIKEVRATLAELTIRAQPVS